VPKLSAEAVSQFGLTECETVVACMLFDGVRTAEIAERRNVSRETVRTQAKSIYLKFGVGSQVALIAKYSNLRG
jgi:DNA-binding CsgD family transcriptional regulator